MFHNLTAKLRTNGTAASRHHDGFAFQKGIHWGGIHDDRRTTQQIFDLDFPQLTLDGPAVNQLHGTGQGGNMNVFQLGKGLENLMAAPLIGGGDGNKYCMDV